MVNKAHTLTGKGKKERILSLPQTIVTAGHYERAISVEMDLDKEH